MEWLVILAIIAGAAVLVMVYAVSLIVGKGEGEPAKRRVRRRRVDKHVTPAKQNIDYRYIKKPALFSVSEKAFYKVLCEVVGDRALVFGQVRIADVLDVPYMRNFRRKKGLFSKISQKHFDYVLCDPNDLSILSVIELDDPSHRKRSRRRSDEFKNEACDAAGLKLHRFWVSDSYDESNLREVIFPAAGEV